jgi:hypothetical protein
MFVGFFLVFFNYKEGLSRKNNFKKKSLRLEVDDTKKVFFFFFFFGGGGGFNKIKVII